MGWVRKKREHRCNLPTEQPIFRRIETGDEWVCRRCKMVWRVTVERWGTGAMLRWKPAGKKTTVA